MKFDLKDLFKKKKPKTKSSKPLFGLDADDDWRIVMVVFLSLTLVVFVWNGFVFYKTNSYLKRESAKEIGTKLIDQKTLEELVVKYISRALEFDKVKAESLNLVDPSK